MDSKSKRALLLGTFTNAKCESIRDYFTLTETSKMFDFNLKGELMAALVTDGPFTSEKTVKLLQFEDPMLGPYTKKFDGIYVMDLGPLLVAGGLQNIGAKFRSISRRLIDAIRYISDQKHKSLAVESCDSPKITGSSVAFAMHLIRTETNRMFSVTYYDGFSFGGDVEYESGRTLAEGQITAQELMRSSSIPDFIESTTASLRNSGVTIVQRQEHWIKEKNMSALLSVAASSGPVVILELILNRTQTKRPLILASKGMRFESSRLGDKPQFYNVSRRNGMGGASCIVGALYALAKLQVQVNVHGILALVWNDQHSTSNKKGSVVYAMNGKSIEVEDPEAESRLVMADVLCYANSLDSCALVDVTTLTSNIDTLVGNSYAVFFTPQERLRQALLRASESSGDKVWQLPFVRHFRSFISDSKNADLSNVGSDADCAVMCKAVSFLEEFAEGNLSWMHIDISAANDTQSQKRLPGNSISGRPTRLVAEFCIEFFEGTD